MAHYFVVAGQLLFNPWKHTAGAFDNTLQVMVAASVCFAGVQHGEHGTHSVEVDDGVSGEVAVIRGLSKTKSFETRGHATMWRSHPAGKAAPAC